MNIALCYESVLPSRGGAETYIADLSRRLARDGHAVHLYACRWDASALPAAMHYHRLEVPRGPRFLRPWRFAQACENALAQASHDVSVGFDKTWGQDILYPQGGLHVACAEHNRLKYRTWLGRLIASVGKSLDPASWSFRWLERRQYLGAKKPLIVVNSRMVREHFERYYGISGESIRIVHSAIDPLRFAAEDRLKRRHHERLRWNAQPDDVVGLFVAMNYRLKGLAPLIRALTEVPRDRRLLIAVVGHPNDRSYRRLAERLGVADRLRFLGFRADPKDAYFAADFLVHPTFYDPCSLVVLEGLACGLPIITTRYNGAAELLTPPNEGLVIDNPHDAPELAKALTQMTDGAYRQHASQAARLAANRWTFEDHYQSLLAIFQDASQMKRAA